MLFNSFVFLLLLVVTFVLYYLPPFKSWQIGILIASSFAFYAYESPWLLILLLFSIFFNSAAAYFIAHGAPESRKLYSTLAIVLNLALLAFFKYSKLISLSFFDASGDVGHFLMMVPLPIGISFFTFEGLSLVIDVYRSKDQAKFRDLVEKNFGYHLLKITLFVSFFPHLVAGPILKAHEFIPQIHNHKKISTIDWEYCFKNLVLGYFLKMVVADNLKDSTADMGFIQIFPNHSSLTLIAFLFGYSMQIFADFAGYSLIALGCAGLFNYKLLDNFNFPYISKSFSEFWRRWHISLSSFLREYLYISLGGNRKGSVRTYFNLIIVMVLGGLWHGASWKFATWGAVHGFALAIERFVGNYIKIPEKGLGGAFRMLGVFLVVTLAWLLFRLTNFERVMVYLYHIVHNWHVAPLLNPVILISIGFYSSFVIFYHAHYLLIEARPHSSKFYSSFFRPFAYAFMLFLILTNSGNAGNFIYFQF